jgi:hypothetical protein
MKRRDTLWKTLERHANQHALAQERKTNMKASDAFPSKYLKAPDLSGRRVAVTIEDVQLEKIGDEQKLVMYFKGKDKLLVLNKTKVNTLTSLFNSEDTDDWLGHSIYLEPGKTQFQGKIVDCINIGVDLPGQAVPGRQAARQQASVAVADDDPPF